MNKPRKRLLSLALAVLLCVGMLPVTALAAAGIDHDCGASYPTGQQMAITIQLAGVSSPGISTQFDCQAGLIQGLIFENGIVTCYIRGIPEKVGEYPVTIKRNTNSDGLLTTNFTIKIVEGSQPFFTQLTNMTKACDEAAFDIGASIGDSPTMTYSSTQPSVATIDSAGIVTIAGVGTTDITVSSTATTNYLATSKTIQLTVNPAQPTVSLVGPAPSGTAGAVGDQTITVAVADSFNENIPLKATINGIEKIASRSGNGNVDFTFTAAELNALAVGNYPITVSSTATTNNDAVTSTQVGSLAVVASSNKAITSFTLAGAAGTIDEGAGTIAVTVPHGTNVTNLTPTVVHTGAAIHTDGTAQDFSSPVTYTVTAADTSTKAYTITVKVAPPSQTGDNDNGSTTPDKAITVIPPDRPNMPTVAKRDVSGKVENQVLAVTITEQMAKDAIKAAQDAANKSGKTADGIAVEFPVTGSSDYESLVVNFDAGAIDRLNAAGVKYVKIGSALIDISFDTKAIAEIDRQSTGAVTLSAMREEKLSYPASAAIGHRPAFDITLKDSKGTAITDLKGGTATIGIAYATKNNGTGSLYAVYVKPNGQIEWLQKSSYTGGRLIFGTGHFSIFGVGYKTPAPAFTDVSGHWARENMEFAASRGLLTGTSATTFSPNTSITRGMFITALGRLSGQDMSSYTVSSFSDVKSGSYYLPYIEWGVKNKIVSGVGGGKFEPDRAITREEMAVMLYNYTKATGYTLPVSVEKITFTDGDNISLWAKDAVKALQQAGIVSGVGGNRFNPKGTGTRAEAATILRNLVERVIDESTARGWSRNDAGQWMYYDWKGERITGWLSITDTDIMYYFDESGVMVSGKWVEIVGKWYYFYNDGKMARNTTIGDYTVGEDGARQGK